MDSQPLDTSADTSSYWSQTRYPFTCLIFLTPLLITYELGVLWLGGTGSADLRNGADCWMRGWLQHAGLNTLFLLPAMVVVALLAWHVCGKYPWKVSFDTLVGMLAESLLFAMCLIALGQLQDLLFREYLSDVALSLPSCAAGCPDRSTAARVVSFVGAGVYEEVMFRLCLLHVCYGVFRILLLPHVGATVLAILSTSLLFSLAHYLGASADEFSVFSFAFRSLAGLFFAVLFTVRGFGITVGCHTAYDLVVGVLLVAQV